MKHEHLNQQILLQLQCRDETMSDTVYFGVHNFKNRKKNHSIQFCLLLLLSWNLSEEGKKFLLRLNNLKNVLGGMASCGCGKANIFIVWKKKKKHTQSDLEWVASTSKSSTILDIFLFCAISNSMVIKCHKLLCAVGLHLSFQVTFELSWLFSVRWCYPLSFRLWCSLESSMESCSPATEYGILSADAIGLNCLLQNSIDCLIILIVRIFSS